jgi:hypothetical protein
MKKTFLFTVSALCSLLMKAQSVDDSIPLKTMLFEKFIGGSVLMKSGEVESAPLNYNTDNQTVVFIKNKQYLVLTGLESIDTVYMQNKKFIPVNKSIFSVVTESAPITLLASYSNTIHPLVSTADHNGSSKQSASQVSNTVTDVYATKLYKDNYSVEIKKHYWFKKNGQLYKVTPKKQFINSFPSRTGKQIDKFIDDNKINFTYEPDLVKLVEFCNKELNY